MILDYTGGKNKVLIAILLKKERKKYVLNMLKVFIIYSS